MHVRSIAALLLPLIALGCSGGAGDGPFARTETIEGSELTRGSAIPREYADTARAKNVVLLIADGMGFSHVNAARAAERGTDTPLAFERLPVVGWQTTHAADRWETDSAAAASAIATGRKYDNQALSLEATTIAEQALADGMALGLITDSFLWDATPAAFVAHVGDRDESAAVIEQMAQAGATLLVGGDRGGAAESFRAAGYDVYGDWLELSKRDFQPDGRWVGLFPEGMIADPATLPRLEQLTEAALRRLSIEPGGFFLLVETEEVDSGSHDQDFARVQRGVAALDRTLESVLSFARADGETLVVVTADHECGGLALVGGDYGEPLELRWATSEHTAEPVPIYAYGPGAERFGGVLDNTDLYHALAAALRRDADVP